MSLIFSALKKFRNRRVPWRPACVAALLLCCSQGCNKPFQVVVPPDFHGTVVIRCTSVGTPSAPIMINQDGAGQGTCPPLQSSIELLREGQHARMQMAPAWDTASDGNTSTIRFVVQP